MTHVVFVAPRFLENTLRYVEAFASLTDAELSLVSEDPLERLRHSLRERVAGHYRIRSVLDAEQLGVAVRAIGRHIGKVDRLAGVLEQLQLPMAAVRERLGIEGPWLEVTRRFRDKDKMKEVLRAAGAPVARSTLARSMADLERFAGEVGLPIVVKPPAGLGARATMRVRDRSELAGLAAIGMAPSAEQPLQAEELVIGREHTCETVSVHGTPIWRSGTRYFPGPLEVLETPWIQYCVLLPREADDRTFTRFHPIGDAALGALGMQTGLSHMEWFLREDGSMVIGEVGARPPGVHIMPLMSLTHEVDMFRAWAELMSFDRFEPVERKWAAGAAFFRGQGEGDRVRRVLGVEQALEEVGASIVEARLPKEGQPRAEGYEGEGWAIVRHETTDGAKHALSRLITNVRVELG
ncbi:MAG: ATP-grasp domain-containing protein [Sandaracinaceae bacterium]|nr:ATP-grasp domain-containing protein [Sandaracinaceae bacterium]